MGFIQEISPFAIEDHVRSGTLASITVAQAYLESARGRHAPGNNFFGIKSTDGTGQYLWTSEYSGGKWIRIQAWFRVYPDLEGCIFDHSDFLRRNKRYTRAGFFDACANLDYRGAAKALQTAGYATDPKYAQSLIDIIESNQLYLLDKEAYKNMKQIDELNKRVSDLEAKLAQVQPVSDEIPVPDWAKASVQKAVAAKIIASPVKGSLDFYRLLVVLDNAKVI